MRVKMTDKMTENGHKVAYLVNQYPNHKINQIIALLQMPAIDINAAIWAAIDLGLINAPDEKTGLIELLQEPNFSKLGPNVIALADTILYCFKKMAIKENDLEENYLSNWTTGYASHDVLIAIKQLEKEKQLTEYMIEDGENSYTFFTLYENRDKQWGRKQFKKDPLKEPSNE